MKNDLDFRPIAYLIVLAGCLLSVAAALVPFYHTGYQLNAGVLLVGILPYLVYGSLSATVRGWPLLIAGALVFGLDAGVKIPERFLHYDGYSSGLVYSVPLLSTFVVLPAILGIGRLLSARSDTPASATRSPSPDHAEESRS